MASSNHTCMACSKNLPKSSFSRTQWRKGNYGRCKHCVNAGTQGSQSNVPPSSSSVVEPPSPSPSPSPSAAVDSFRVVVVMGPPGSGKGTQCQKLAKKHGMVHLSTGDVFRDAVARNTPLGRKAAPYIAQGHFLPDKLVADMVLKRLKEADTNDQGVLLDGFPRTGSQARLLAAHIDVERFMLLQCADSICVQRILGRRVDPSTGAIYHLKHAPPPSQAVKDRLQRREFDVDEPTVRSRLRTYHSQLGLILPHFQGKIVAVNAGRSITEVSADMERNFTKALPKVDKAARVKARSAAAAASAKQQAAVPSCSVCLDQPADYLVVPCGHQCGCKPCLDTIKKTTGGCPICRQRIAGIVRVYRVGSIDDSKIPLDDEPEQTVDQKDAAPSSAAAPEAVGSQPDDGGWGSDAEDDEKKGVDAVVSVAPCHDVTGDPSISTDVAVSVSVPDTDVRQPVDVCCVVDISGSMQSAATFQDEENPDSGRTKNSGLSILDLVKHAVRTVMHTLTDQDRLALVAFDSTSDTAFALGEMTEGGRKQAIRALEQLRPRGQTNLWGGLLRGLEALRAGDDSKSDAGTRKKCVLLLTDGLPNIIPPRGHLPELHDYKEKHPEFKFQINTFGFGYSLDSKLLLDLAKDSGGTFAFIPDAKILGTCFVNCVANAVSTLAQSSTVHLMLKGDAKFAGDVKGSYPSVDASWGKVVELGPIQFGQSRDLVVPLHIPASATGSSSSSSGGSAYLEAMLVYKDEHGREVKVSGLGTTRVANVHAVAAQARCAAVDTGYQAVNDAASNRGQKANRDWATLAGRIAGQLASYKDDERLQSVHKDVSGRMAKAFNTKERFKRWGGHYLRALLRSHQLQQCTNFMDPGLQKYGGRLFRRMRDTGGAIFISLPLPVAARPVPSVRRASATSAGNRQGGKGAQRQRQRPPSPPTTQTFFAGAGGGCFAEYCTVDVACGPHTFRAVPLAKLSAGARVKVHGGGVATVRCVVSLQRATNKQMYRLPGGLVITGSHPVLVGGRWIKPRDHPLAKVTDAADTVFNLVLDSTHVAFVSGTACVTWGHHLKDPAVAHPFYGTDCVLSAIAQLPGWSVGRVHVQGVLRQGTKHTDACTASGAPVVGFV